MKTHFVGFLLLFFTCTIASFTQNINTAIFYKVKTNSITFKAESGRYDIISNNKIPHSIEEGDSIIIELFKEEKIKIIDNNNEIIGKFKHLLIRGNKQNSYFLIYRNDTLTNIKRAYDNDLNISIADSTLLLVNDVNFEKYIAGVVEAEGGPNAPIEYFKTQAILCRTYAMKHYEKHLEEGFNLCDDVHCQAYKGRCKQNLEILKASIETAGLVIVDKNLQIISATFYANSGGETVNSEDVWVSALPYLRTVTDKYSINQTGYKWKKEINKSDWVSYLKDNGFNISDSNPNFEFSQITRAKYYTFNGSSIPLKDIRTDWQLRSTFFSIEQKNDKLIFNGKGYGHGVGLSQEGAMEMARQNFTYDTIIKHYYQGVNVMSIKAINFFQIE